MKAEIIDKFACPTCLKYYDESDEAADCCPVRIERGYGCSLCPDYSTYSRKLAEKHLLTPHGEAAPDDQYVHLLFEGLPPLEAWRMSHRFVSDDRRIVEEVLINEATVGSYL